MNLTLEHTLIKDVLPDEILGGGRIKVLIQVNEEDLFSMLDQVKPKNIIKYLDMRRIDHREPSVINIYGNDSHASSRNKRKYERILSENENLKLRLLCK